MLDPNDPRTYTLENLEELSQLLAAAMEGGDQQLAENIVSILAKQRIKCSVKLDAASLKDGTKDTEFSVKVHIEDREQSGGAITLKVKPTDTVRDLKHKMFLKHHFPIEVQRWIIGKRLASDRDTLKYLRVAEGTSLYLYLVSAKSIGLRKEDFDKTLLQMQQLMAQGNLGFGHLSMESTEYGTGGLSIPPTPQSANLPSRQRSLQSLGSLNQSSTNQQIPYNQQRSRDSQGSSLQGQGQILRSSRSVSSQIIDEDPAPELRQDVLERITGGQIPNEGQQESDKQGQNAGWTCEKCTFINQPTRPGCEICGANRPESYKIPEGYQLSEAEKQRIEKEKEMEKKAQQAAVQARERNYQRLLAVEEQSLVPNTDEFECPICFNTISEGEGVVLRECLHKFCRDCLKCAVEYNEEATLKCPFQDDSYSCSAPLQEREIKALVPAEMFSKYLQRGLNTAENQEVNSFHCRTANCPGWCIYEDMVNFFQCPVCRHENCLTCKAIHTGLNCKQYQEDLKIRSANDEAARSTQQMLQSLVDEGEAMHCPGCKVIVQKKEGCDWIRCSICKMEICWVTKGPRWGPLGTGDFNGGCGCRLDGQRCHPDCTNCH